MRRYFFAWWDKIAEQITLTGSEEINIDIVNEIKNMQSPLGEFLLDQFYYGMLCKNFQELLEIIKTYEINGKSFKYNHEYIPYANELNRLMINSLGSIFTYLNHFEYTYKKEGKEKELANFKAVSSKYFDTRFIYRFFYKLRNYAVHCEIPITCLQDSINAPGSTFYFDTQALLDGFDWGKIVKADLQNGDEKYCVKELVIQALSMYREFHIEIISTQLRRVIVTMKQLGKYSRIKNNSREFPVFLVIDEDNPNQPNIQSIITDNYISVDKALKDLAIDLKYYI